MAELLTPSPDRCPARCSSFGQCGGCVWQDLDYAVQLKYKASQVAESLEHLGGIHDFELMPIVGMDDPWRYRNRADFSIGQGEEGAVVGFRPPGRWDSVLQLSECHLLGSSIERVRATVETWLREHDVPGWNPRTAEGYARHLLVRSAQGGHEVLVSLVTIPGELPDADGFVRRLREMHPEVVGIFHCGQRRYGRDQRRAWTPRCCGAGPTCWRSSATSPSRSPSTPSFRRTRSWPTRSTAGGRRGARRPE